MKTLILNSPFFLLYFVFFTACSSEQQNGDLENGMHAAAPVFTRIGQQESGIDFTNKIIEDDQYHYFNYPYLYNGGGVAAGDINNDGLPDLYFSGNSVQDELYLNTGNLSFKKITKAAGIKDEEGVWHTGVMMWDANSDDLLDIYVCRSGKSESDALRTNLLYINQGNLTFKESAAEFGLADPGYSTQAYPFDYDKDGDLDLYVVNSRIDFQKNAFYNFEDDKKIEFNSSDRLYRNDSPAGGSGQAKFTNVSEAAGISNKAWGLSAAIDDFNKDGWDDIYVANDFHQPDYLYLNRQDGTFSESLTDYFRHTSFYSMGSDVADINNDGHPDLVVLDMVSENHLRSKRMMAAMSNDNFRLLVANGYHYQYMNNVLQLNNGTGPFSEVAQLAGIAKTDWSWAPLLADFDNDGWKDLFITNGIKKDVTDNDFRISMEQELKEKGKLAWKVASDRMPSSTIPNYIFKNNKNLKFEKQTSAWGLAEPVNSNGAAYADLDLDGDLELIVNNMDAPSTIYKNHTVEKNKFNHLKIQFAGPANNSFGIGCEVRLYTGEGVQVQRLFPARGFQSSVESTLHFGLGNHTFADSLTVYWPDGKIQQLGKTKANQMLELDYKSATLADQSLPYESTVFREIYDKKGLDFRHQENAFDDFKLEVLLPHKQSEFGPMISTADVNGDGLEDCFIGGAHQQSGKLFLQQQNGNFKEAPSQPWKAESASEDLQSLFFDADQDGDPDLYVVSGGAVFRQGHPALQDRLYINDGTGNFRLDPQALPEMRTSGLSICAGDIDQDGDLDLFAGGRLIPGNYPLAPRSFLLENKGGKFTDVTDILAPALMNPGLVSDAVFTDFDNDNDLDLIIVGEWMPVSLFENEEGFFLEATEKAGFSGTSGWWSKIEVVDWDKDGDPDYILGNMGENNKFHPSGEQPLHIYANDFDHNNTLDIYLAKEKNAAILPVRGRECSSQQMPGILKKFPTYNDFGNAQLAEILGAKEMEEAYHLKAETMSSMFLSNEAGKFSLQALPVEAQFSQINGIITEDFNTDGYPDLLIAGNNLGAEVETVRYDASSGMLFYNDQRGGFISIPTMVSGFLATGNVKSMALIPHRSTKGEEPYILIGNNNGPVQIWVQHTKYSR